MSDVTTSGGTGLTKQLTHPLMPGSLVVVFVAWVGNGNWVIQFAAFKGY